jgi:predicted ATP-grasp superfamily ATP-dependent carboligase
MAAPVTRGRFQTRRLWHRDDRNHWAAFSPGNQVISDRDRTRRALILAEGPRLQYRVLRCAAEYFNEVYILGTPESTKLRLSRFCTKFFRFSGSFDVIDATSIAQVNALCERLSIDWILPSCSVTTRFLTSHNRHLVSPHYPVPSREVFDVLDDKWRFSGLCANLGIPHPRTLWFATSKDFLAAATDGLFSYPLVIKPLGMWGSFGVKKIDSPAEVPVEVGYEPILVQDYVPGRDSCAFFMCRDGRIITSIEYIRTPRGVTFARNAEVERNAKVIIEHLRYNGVIGFDVRRSQDGDISFIECNPRFWYRMDLAMILGVNFVALGCSDTQPEGFSEVTILAPRRLVRTMFTPWRLGFYDIAFLKYLARDPLLNTLVAVESALGGNRLATGQSL